MSSPLRRTMPSTLAFGIVSCMRLRQRINVDLPQPDGPMIAETACSSKSNVMSSIAFFGPYHADTLSVRIFAAIASSPRDGTKPDHDPRHDRNAEHHEDKDQGGAPGGLVQGRVRAEREHVDRVRQRLARLIQTLPPKRAPEGDEREDHAQEGGDVHREILPLPPGVPVEPEHHAAPSPRRRTRPSISRAKTLMRSDISMRTSPSSMRALSSSGSVAFRKLFAIQLAMVCPWSKREMEIALRFPIVMVTAIVSPTARPRPRMIAPKIPARAYRRTATRVVSHRVAPRLKAASR